MNGIKIVTRGKNLKQAQAKDLTLSTDLITIPILTRVKISLTLEAGVTYGLANVDFPTGQYEHGLRYAPLFRGWVETVDITSGTKTGQKLSLPVNQTPFVWSLRSDNRFVMATIATTGATYAPVTKLTFDYFVYVLGSRIE